MKSSAPPPPPPGHPMLPRMMRVLRTRRETHDAFSFELDAAEHGGYRFEPGQFNMLYVPGAGESAISVSGDPERNGRLVHTIREVGNVTRALGRLHRGDMVGVRGPFGVGWPLGEARGRDVVVVAGGVGLAPLRPVLYAIAHRREDFGGSPSSTDRARPAICSSGGNCPVGGSASVPRSGSRSIEPTRTGSATPVS